ncbi:MAG: hypothetical protein R3F20_02465 [Planctomycetota bacterium]
MAIEVACPGCEAEYRVSDDKAGRRFECKSCETVVEVPELAAVPTDAMAEATEEESATASMPLRGPETASSGRGRSTGSVRSESSNGKLVRRAPSNLGPVLGMAAAVAVVGALVWGAVTYLTNFEIGWIAWGIGAAAGAAAVKAGGFGARDAVIVGIIAVVAILGGKYLGHLAYVKDAVETSRRIFLQEHEILAETAEEVATLEEGDEEERAEARRLDEFAIHRLATGQVPAAVVPVPFVRMHPVEARALWREVCKGQSPYDYAAVRTDALRRSGKLDFSFSAFGGSGKGAVLDIVFIILGFGTAAGMVMKQPAFVRN